MKTFILGMTDHSMLTDEVIVEFASKKEAEETSAEWCEVQADTLEKAIDLYEGVYHAWYRKGFVGEYPTPDQIAAALADIQHQ